MPLKVVTCVLSLSKVTMFFLDENKLLFGDGVTKYPRTYAFPRYGNLGRSTHSCLRALPNASKLDALMVDCTKWWQCLGTFGNKSTWLGIKKRTLSQSVTTLQYKNKLPLPHASTCCWRMFNFNDLGSKDPRSKLHSLVLKLTTNIEKNSSPRAHASKWEVNNFYQTWMFVFF